MTATVAMAVAIGLAVLLTVWLVAVWALDIIRWCRRRVRRVRR